MQMFVIDSAFAASWLRAYVVDTGDRIRRWAQGQEETMRARLFVPVHPQSVNPRQRPRRGRHNRLVTRPIRADISAMNLISILIGLIALPLALIAFLPLLGWLYWFILPIAIVGLVFGAISRGRTGRNLNLIVIVVGVLRLMIGGGIF